MQATLIFIGGLVLALSGPAHAYIGPGLGAGTIGVILGVLGSILLAVFAIFWYPIKRLFKGKKQPEEVEAETPAEIEKTEAPAESDS